MHSDSIPPTNNVLQVLDSIDDRYYELESITKTQVTLEQKEEALIELNELAQEVYGVIFELGFEFKNLQHASLEILYPQKYLECKSEGFIVQAGEPNRELQNLSETEADLLGRAIYRLGRIFALNAQYQLMSDLSKPRETHVDLVNNPAKLQEYIRAENSVYLSNVMFSVLKNPLFGFSPQDVNVQLAHNYRRLVLPLIAQRNALVSPENEELREIYDAAILDANFRSLELFLQQYKSDHSDSTLNSILTSYNFTLESIRYSEREDGADSELVSKAMARLEKCYRLYPRLRKSL